MGLMAADAERKLFPRLVCQTAMGPFVDLIQDIRVAVPTLFDTEEILQALVHVPGVWMRLIFCNAPVAFQAGGLPMRRNMEPFRID
jgi:hypothetical protein